MNNKYNKLNKWHKIYNKIAVKKLEKNMNISYK